jgi:surface protein
MKKYLLLTLFALLNSFAAMAQEAYAVYLRGTLTFYYDNQKSNKQGTVYELNSTLEPPAWREINPNVTKVVFHSSFADARPVSTFAWFVVNLGSYTSSLTTIEGIENLNTSSVTNMDSMFAGCTELTTLDLSHFDTSNVTKMDYMFDNCSNLTTIYCGENWNTDKVESSWHMFWACKSLVGGARTVYDANHVDVSYAHIDGGERDPGYLTQYGATPPGPEAYAVFDEGTFTFYCDNKKDERQDQGTVYELNSEREAPAWFGITPDITKVVFDTSFADARPVSTFEWFAVDNETNISSLTTIEGIKNLNTSCVTDMEAMFYGCTKLITLDLSHFNTSNVTNMNMMFTFCSNLTTIEGIENLKTSNVTYMTGMFYGCTNLTTLNLSNFNTSNVTNMEVMFNSCSNLTKIYCGANWSSDKLKYSDSMFEGCTSLVGGEGTVYDASHVDGTYAHADGGPDNPGYLTLKGVDVTDVSQIANVIYAEEIEECSGKQVTLSLMMKNTAPIRAFQFDLYLPEGVTPATSDGGDLMVALNRDRRTEDDGHTLTVSYQPDGAIRFLCGSFEDETFTGNEGEIANLQINLSADMAVGEYPIVLKSVRLTESDISNYYLTEEVVSKLNIITYVTGDASGDDVVDVLDYTGVANYIHGRVPAGFNVRAADVDENNVIDVSDYTGIANIIHYGSPYGRNGVQGMPKRAADQTDAENVIYLSPMTVAAGSQASLSIMMKSTAPIRGFQFDLYLPEGMTAAKNVNGRIQSSLSANGVDEGDSHTLSFSEQPDGAIRFLCSSMYDETFRNGDIEIATIQVDADTSMSAGDYTMLLENMKLTETNISRYYITEQVETMLTIANDPTGISVMDALPADGKFYDLQGRLVEHPTKGLYIKNNKKMIIK